MEKRQEISSDLFFATEIVWQQRFFERIVCSWQAVELKKHWISWEQRKLIEVCDYVDYRGKTPTKVNNGIFLVTAKNVKDGYIDYESSKEYISEDDYEEVMRRGKPEIGDVLITTEAPCGNIAQVNTSNIALAQRIIKYRGHKNVINNTYLKHYMLAPHFQKILFEKSSGGTVQGIKGSILHQQDVIYPMYDEQVKMGVYFDSLDHLITLHQRKLELLKRLRNALVDRCFTGEKITMSKLILYHGSPNRVIVPKFGFGEDRHDCGRGFYLTENLELAKEWAVCRPESECVVF